MSDRLHSIHIFTLFALLKVFLLYSILHIFLCILDEVSLYIYVNIIRNKFINYTLLICAIVSFRILQGSADTTNSNDGGPEFAEVFVIVWIGSMVVTMNSKLLGGNM